MEGMRGRKNKGRVKGSKEEGRKKERNNLFHDCLTIPGS